MEKATIEHDEDTGGNVGSILTIVVVLLLLLGVFIFFHKNIFSPAAVTPLAPTRQNTTPEPNQGGTPTSPPPAASPRSTPSGY